MRIARIAVSNFRGIHLAELKGLEAAPLLTLSGRNGAGKTQLLEAIAAAWTGRWYQPDRLTGPWGPEGSVEIEISLTDQERTDVTAFREQRGQSPGDCPPRLVRTVSFNQTGLVSQLNSHPALETLLDGRFRREHPFATIDYYPADRRIARNDNPAIDPGMVGEARTEEFRNVLMETAIRQRQTAEMPAVPSFLATLDYMDLMSARQGGSVGAFSSITGVFSDATGKSIQQPVSSPETGVRISVRTEAGAEHPVSELSRGEQEALGIIYFVHRLAARGGVLLMDEPELHLHPTLQGSLFQTVQSLGERSQVWAATHSPKLLTAAPLSAIVHMHPASADGANQAAWAADEAARTELLADLGMHPADLMQHDLIVVVEGPTDDENLRAVFPVELSRALIYNAGGARAVVAAAETLAGLRNPVPWFVVRDRDFLTDTEVSALNDKYHHQIFVWPRRTIENHLLEPTLISKTLERAGQPTDPRAIETELKRIADGMRDEVFARLLEAKLERAFPASGARGTHGAKQLQDWYEQAQAMSTRRLEKFDAFSREVEAELDARWTGEWSSLVQGKAVLAQLLPAISAPFKNYPAFKSALVATAGAVPEVTPAAFNEFSEQLRTLLNSPKHKPS